MNDLLRFCYALSGIVSLKHDKNVHEGVDIMPEKKNVTIHNMTEMRDVLWTKNMNIQIKQSENAYDKLEGFRQSLLDEMTGFNDQLMQTRKEAETNFIALEDPSVREMEKEDMAVSENVVSGLRACMAVLADTSKTPDEMKAGLDNLWQVICDASREKHEMSGGSYAENGRLGKEIVADMRNYLEIYRKQFMEMEKALEDSYTNIPGVEGTGLSMKERGKLKQKIIGGAKGEYVNNVEGLGKEFADRNRLSVNKALFIRKLSERNPFDTRRTATYSPYLPDAAEADLAKNYLTKMYIKNMMTPQLEVSDLRSYMSELDAEAFEKHAASIAENPIFKDLVKKKPNSWFKDWNMIDQKADELSSRMAESLSGYTKEYKSLEEYVVHKAVDGAKTLDRVEKDVMYQNLTDVIVREMLADKNCSVRYAVAVKPEKEELLRTAAAEYLKKENVLGDNPLKNVAHAMQVVKKAMNNSVKTGILKKFAKDEKKQMMSASNTVNPAKASPAGKAPKAAQSAK